MTGGRAARRKKQAWRKRYENKVKSLSLVFACPHCGSTEPHFIPPSLGDPGFFACKMVTPGGEDG